MRNINKKLMRKFIGDKNYLSMNTTNEIRKVISEQVEKKSLLNKESNIIKKRLQFVLESSNRRHLSCKI